MVLRNIKLFMYNKLVSQVPIIKLYYEDYAKIHNKKYKKILYLIKINFIYHVLKFQFDNSTDSKKKCYSATSESHNNYEKSVQSFVDNLSQFDVISFDIFDTLIFRPFNQPADVFYLIAEKLNYLDFKNIRELMEKRAREDQYKKTGSYEVNIDTIYSYIETFAGIPKEVGVSIELEVEQKVCYSNKYMKDIFYGLLAKGKKIIITSDMYIGKEYMESILNKCGYEGYVDIYISCDYGKSKANGNMYKFIKDSYGINLSYAHIGDNEISDIENSRKYGFTPFLYKNVNKYGNAYRSKDMSALVGSAYRGLVNNKLYSQAEILTSQYEYGYNCGGIFVLGYCQFIHKYYINEKIDKILFLARDGDILSTVYSKLFPEDNIEYVYWSRLAGTKMTASYYKFDYMKKFLHHKINSGRTIKNILRTMELDFLIDQCPINVNKQLDNKNIFIIEEYLFENWERVLKQYNEQINAGREYYEKILNGCHKVLSVDVGWAGSGAISLNHLVNDIWKLKCKMIGVIAGTNSRNSFEVDASEAQLQNGTLIAYIYSQMHNRRIWAYHNPSKKHNVYFEMLLTSTKPSFKGFYYKNNELDFQFTSEESANKDTILEIQQGILDFIEDYLKHFRDFPYMFNISGSDAYAPFMLVSNDESYMNFLFDSCTFVPCVGDDGITNTINKL